MQLAAKLHGRDTNELTRGGKIGAYRLKSADRRRRAHQDHAVALAGQSRGYATSSRSAPSSRASPKRSARSVGR
jgi:hypothetical protein